MKDRRSGVGTLGLLGLALTVLVITGHLSAWFLIAGVFFIIVGIGDEIEDHSNI